MRWEPTQGLRPQHLSPDRRLAGEVQVNEFVEHQPALLLPSRHAIWHVEGGLARTRVIELSAHQLLE